jgi:serine/threonine protein kinase, bacterial
MTTSATPSDPPVPASIGPHTVQKRLGSGGMGFVYLARDANLDRSVAIKVLRAELLHQEEMRARFVREARALAKVTSPSVVTIHSVGEDVVLGPFVVMELLEGEDLATRVIREGRLPWESACALAVDACAGLLAAHEAGLVHRDVKPANLIVVAATGKAKLTDFGLARAHSHNADAQLTAAGLILGTPTYLAPEIARGHEATMQSDIYSLGATLFHLIVGDPPFPGTEPILVLANAATQPAPRLDARVQGLPAALVELVDAMLRKDPAARPQGVVDVRDRLMLVKQPRSQHTMPLHALLSAEPVVAPVATWSPEGAPLPAASVRSESPVLAIDGGKVRSASLTLMMTDIAGYSQRTSQQSREESARWLAVHDALLMPVFTTFGGRVVKTLGDAFLVTFASPTDAVLCGCAIQDRLHLHNRGASVSDQIVVRVALSAGDVRLHKGDVFGEPVNLVARLEALAKPGDVLLSDAVFMTMNTAEVRTERVGEQQLRGIGRPVVVYRALTSRVHAADLPYGGVALARVHSSVVNNGWRRFRASAAMTMARLQTSWSRVPLKHKAMVVGMPVVAALLLLMVGGGDDHADMIADGRAKEVIAAIEQRPEGDRSAEDWRHRGLAYVATGAPKRGFGSLLSAAKMGDADADARDAALAAIGVRDDHGAAELLQAWPNDDINAALSNELDDDRFWQRQHALEILEARTKATDAQRMAVGLRHVTESDCDMRRAGLLLLKRSGKGAVALAAIKKLGDQMPANLCMMMDVGAATDAVKRRGDK